MRPTPPTADHGDPVPTTERPAPVGPVGRPSVTRRARPPRALVLRAVALGAALLTASVVAGDLRALHRRAAALGPDVGVVAATRDLPLGTRLGADDLRVLTRPARTVAPDAVGSVDDAIGRTVAVPLLAGDIVRNRTLTAGAAAGIDGLIPAGMRAVRLRPADGARPPTGSTVDVLALVGPPASTGAPAVAVAVGATVLAVAAESSGESAVTILVTEAEAPGVVAAHLGGPIGLALAPPPATGRSDRVPAPPG